MTHPSISNPLRRLWQALAATTCVALAACGGGGGGTEAPATQAPPATAMSESALREAEPGALAQYFRQRLQQRAAQGLGTVDLLATVTTTQGAGALTGGTVLQEAGVDEDDLIKADGAMVYALHPAYTADGVASPARLTAQRRQADGSLATPATTTLNTGFTPRGMFVLPAASRLAVLGQTSTNLPFITVPGTGAQVMPSFAPASQRVSLDLFSTADAGRPVPATRLELDGTLVGSRMIGSVLYVVSSWTPEVTHFQLAGNATAAQATAVPGSLTAADLLPQVRVDGAAPQPLVTEASCLLQPANASLGLQLTTITAFDLRSPGLPRSSRCFVGGVEALYMSPNHVYLASSRQYWSPGGIMPAMVPPTAQTDIHKFALQGLAIDYRGSGEVPGHLGWDAEKRPYRLSEYQGDLRVLTFTGATGWGGNPAATTRPGPASPATLTVLREDTAARSLNQLAQLPNAQRPAPLGLPGEQVYAVHFAGPMAYVVTFRRTDPLYVLDLSNPADPRAVGELVMPGFSDFLFTLPGNQLLGVGRDATTDGRQRGLKLALFDVAVPASPRLLASQTLGDMGSSSALDYSRHGISLLAQGAQVRVALPVRLTDMVGGTVRFRQQGLARYTVDTAAGTLTEAPFVVATPFDGSAADAARFQRFDLGKERALQTDTGAYYLSGGAVVHAP